MRKSKNIMILNNGAKPKTVEHPEIAEVVQIKTRAVKGEFSDPEYRVILRSSRKGNERSRSKHKGKRVVPKLAIVRIQTNKELDDD